MTTLQAKASRWDALLRADGACPEIAAIVSGGVADCFESDHPTGVIAVRSLRDLHHKYPEIDWVALGNDPEACRHPRLVHLAKVMAIAFRRRTWEPLPLGETTLHVVHLNTHVQIPLFSPLARRSVEASPLPYYGLPAVYVSAARHGNNGELLLSEGSLDIIRERATRQLSYSRGVIFTIDPRAVFQIDRKANVRYRMHFITQALKADLDLAPPDATVRRHAQLLERATQCRDPAGTLSDGELQSLLDAGRELGFSVLGACLFEATHEFLMERVHDLKRAREIMFALDPRQKVLWSMHAFGTDLPVARSAMVEHNLPETGLVDYLKANVIYKLRAYLGDIGQYTEACAFDCEFGRLNYALVRDGDADPACARLELDLAKATLPDGLGLGLVADPARGALLRFEQAAIEPAKLSAACRHASTNGWGPQFEGALRAHRYKTIFNRYLDQVSANTLKILVYHDLGCLAVPFQPDPRGELLLVPTANPTSVVEARRMLIRKTVSQLIELEEALDAPVLIRNRSGFDPLLHHANPLWYSRSPNLADAYRPTFDLIARRVDQQIPAIAHGLPLGRPLSVVVIPFFKERDSYVGVARQSLLAASDRDATAVIAFVSNQSRSDFARNVIRAEALLGPELRAAPLGSRLIGINSAEVCELKHWMIEKYINVHAGLYFAQTLAESTGLALREVAVLEGDVHDVGPWWAAYHALPRPSPDAVVFQPRISIVDESSGAVRAAGLDTSDVAMAKLFCAPLSMVLLGCNAEQLLGGNYILSEKALHRFLDHLHTSDHSESLIETWLLPLASGGCSLRLLNVPGKAHFSTSQPQLTGSNRKLIKWVGDLFYSFDLAIGLGMPEVLPLKSVRADEPERYPIAASECEWNKDDWIHEIDRGDALLWPVIEQVLLPLPALRAKYRALVTAAAPAAGTRPTAVDPVTGDEWMETVVRFFLETRGRRREEIEEMFALRFLFVLFTMGRLSDEEDVVQADLDLTPQRIAACRGLVADRLGLSRQEGARPARSLRARSAPARGRSRRS